MHQPEENVLYQTKDAWYPEYEVKVVQLKNPHHGKLTVSYKDEVFYTEIVAVSYGAPFGADMMDIQAWSHIACDMTDKHLKRRGIEPGSPNGDNSAGS